MAGGTERPESSADRYVCTTTTYDSDTAPHRLLTCELKLCVAWLTAGETLPTRKPVSSFPLSTKPPWKPRSTASHTTAPKTTGRTRGTVTAMMHEPSTNEACSSGPMSPNMVLYGIWRRSLAEGTREGSVSCESVRARPSSLPRPERKQPTALARTQSPQTTKGVTPPRYPALKIFERRYRVSVEQQIR